MASDVSIQTTGDEPIRLIEFELLKLDRFLEMIGRRTDLYRRVDRAGYLVLRTLDRAGPLNINALSGTLGLHASTVTRQVNRLEHSGFVSRRVNREDQRSSTIGLNALGRRSMRAVENERHNRIKSVLNGWTQDERDSLGYVLAKLNDTIAGSPEYRELRQPVGLRSNKGPEEDNNAYRP